MNLKEMIGQERIDSGMWWSKGCGLQIVEGCTKVSPGCDNCWSLAAANMRRFNPNPKVAARYEGTVTRVSRHCVACQEANYNCNHHPGPPQWTGLVNPQWADLDKIGRARKPQVYTFWNDLFHEGVSFDLAGGKKNFIDEVIIRIITHPQHFYIICTKRLERALEYFLSRQDDLAAWPVAKEILSRRLMLMTTVENQDMADLRLPVLLQIHGVLHGVSYEPALGAVDFRKYLSGWKRTGGEVYWSNYNVSAPKLDCVVCGGETGPQARPMHPDWPRQARDQCQAAEVPFYFKSWGEWLPLNQAKTPATNNYHGAKTKSNWHWHPGNPSEASIRVGKKAAGRLLDGRPWDEVPHVG